MSQKIINNTNEIAIALKTRRLELGLTIEAAAKMAGVGTKTWSRYEAGESIRYDKVKGICKAMKWKVLPEYFSEKKEKKLLDEYQKHEAWSDYICKEFGEAAAISFVVGSDILSDYIEEELNSLSSKPKGTHLGQTDFSMLETMLPKQFLMEYDYNFLYKLRCVVNKLRLCAKNNVRIIAHSVIEELVLYLMMESAELLMDSLQEDMEKEGIKNATDWKEWIFDLFDDCDIVTCLYSDIYVSDKNIYHFDYWYDEQFYTNF